MSVTAQSLLVFMTLASIVSLAALTLYIVLNFSQLGTDSKLGEFETSASQSVLSGPYESGLSISSGAVLFAVFVCSVWGYVSKQQLLSTPRGHLLMMFTVASGIVLASMDLAFVFDYSRLVKNGSLTIEDGKMQGSLGNGLLGVASTSVALSGLSMLHLYMY